MYYVLETVIKDAMHASLIRNNDEEDTLWVKGSIVDTANIKLPLEIVCEKRCEKKIDLLDVGLAYACSSRFKKIIENLNINNIQFFKALIRSKDGVINDDFYIMNIVGRQSVLDMESSDYTEYRGKVFRMNSMSLDSTKTLEFDIFRLHEYQEVVLISERLKDAFSQSDLKGLVISSADGWNDHHRF